MTISEKDDKIQEYCRSVSDYYADCEMNCKIFDICTNIGGDFGNHYPEETEKAYNIIYDTPCCDTPCCDNVNHPKHYCRDGGMECIDEMLLIFGKSAVMAYCLLNSWKYRYRAADKNGEEDLKKSDWYIRKYKQLKEEMDNE